MLALAIFQESIAESGDDYATSGFLVERTTNYLQEQEYEPSDALQSAAYAFDSLVYDNFIVVNSHGWVLSAPSDLPLRHRAHVAGQGSVQNQLDLVDIDRKDRDE
jgi:hypothetical protein